jgi:hypothetical protein
MKTVITHFYNEEYMLPWWLMHNREVFDHGVLIDYDSTDRSLEIIKEYCPTWQVVKSRNRQFDARKCDEEIIDCESTIPGWKICLNVTEYLVGDYSLLNDEPGQVLKVPCYIMVDTQKDVEITHDKSLLKQKPFGILYNSSIPITIERCCRAIHNTTSLLYPTGRHFLDPNCMQLQVLWYGYSPMNQKMLERKLQIQHRIPDSDKAQGFGGHHITDEQVQNEKYNRYLPFVTDLSVELKL